MTKVSKAVGTGRNSSEALDEWLAAMVNRAEIPIERKANILRVGRSEINKGGWRGDITEELVRVLGPSIKSELDDLYL